jgi:hypothetical protein
MASATDVFARASNGTRPTPTTLTAILASGSSPGTATCAALTGWPTTSKVHFCIYTINTSGAKVAGSQTDWVGVVSGSTITGLTLKAGTNVGYSVGAVVEASPIAAYADDLFSGLTAQHSAVDGSHTNITATGLTIASGTVSLPSASINQTALPLGSLAQAPQSTNFSAVASSAATIPFDDTIPQITEGAEYMTQAITPKSATNILLIQVVGFFSYAAGDWVSMALFQDATANALAASAVYIDTASAGRPIPLTYKMVAGTTSSTTFRVRAGGGLATAVTTTFNGQSGGRKFGGIGGISNITITEYKA